MICMRTRKHAHICIYIYICLLFEGTLFSGFFKGETKRRTKNNIGGSPKKQRTNPILGFFWRGRGAKAPSVKVRDPPARAMRLPAPK